MLAELPRSQAWHGQQHVNIAPEHLKIFKACFLQAGCVLVERLMLSFLLIYHRLIGT